MMVGNVLDLKFVVVRNDMVVNMLFYRDVRFVLMFLIWFFLIELKKWCRYRKVGIMISRISVMCILGFW